MEKKKEIFEQPVMEVIKVTSEIVITSGGMDGFEDPDAV